MTRFTAIPKIAVLVIIFCLVCGSICIPLSIVGRSYYGSFIVGFPLLGTHDCETSSHCENSAAGGFAPFQ
jgi:hypothetical protein